MWENDGEILFIPHSQLAESFGHILIFLGWVAATHWLFPTCQVRVSRFYQSYFLLPSSALLAQWRAPDVSGHCQTSTASARSQWALPDLDRELQTSVGMVGQCPRQRMPE